MSGGEHSAARFARARERARTPKNVVRVAFAIAVAVHLLLGLALYELMRPAPTQETPGMLVQIFDAPPAEPSLPEPPSARHPPAMATSPTPATRATTVTSTPATAAAPANPSNPPAPGLQLFTADGAVRLAPAAKATPHEEGMARARELLARGHNVLHCSQNALDTRATAEEDGAHRKRQATLWGFMYQRPWEIQAQHDSQIKIGADMANDLTIAAREVADQACDDTLYRRGYPETNERNGSPSDRVSDSSVQ